MNGEMEDRHHFSRSQVAVYRRLIPQARRWKAAPGGSLRVLARLLVPTVAFCELPSVFRS